jgi:hypothetical protein
MKKYDFTRKTIEVRIAEAGGTKDPFLIKNWIRLLIHFVEMCKFRKTPGDYEIGKPPLINGMVWLDLEDVLSILGFNNNPYEYHLSNGLTQIRNWMLGRIQKNLTKHSMPGMPRHVPWKQFQDVMARFRAEGVEIDLEESLKPRNMTESLYSEDFKY